MNGQGPVQKGEARPWPLYSDSALGARLPRLQDAQRPRSKAAVGHRSAVCRDEQRAAVGRLEVHARVQGLAISGHTGPGTSSTHRKEPDFPYSDWKNAKCRELVCLLLVATGSRPRHGRRAAVITARRLLPLGARLTKQFDVHGSRVNNTPYKHGYRANSTTISTAAVSMRGVSAPSIGTVAVHYLDKPSLWPRSRWIYRGKNARGPPANHRDCTAFPNPQSRQIHLLGRAQRTP